MEWMEMDARTIHFHAVDTWTVDVEWIASLNDELDSIRHETHKLTGEDPDNSDFEAPATNSPAAAIGGGHSAFIFGFDLRISTFSSYIPYRFMLHFMLSVSRER
ncbi:hypothetical protein NW765_017691 [Fusarium oxysporum]|nr:hypothetical protein NW765_017691 [Fusarium oxysporum]